MRKIRMTSSTSISGMKLISGSSRPRAARKFTVPPLALRASHALAVHEIDEADRLLLHLDDETVDLAAEMPIENHARYRNDESECGVIERDRNAVRELNRIAGGRRLRSEYLDHSHHRPEEAE